MAKLWRTIDAPTHYQELSQFADDANALVQLERLAKTFELEIENTEPDSGYYEYYVEIPDGKLNGVLSVAAEMPLLQGSTVDVHDDEDAELAESLGFSVGDLEEGA